MMLFQAPQLSQRPDHLACTAPQDWQMKVDKAFAKMHLVKPSLYRSRESPATFDGPRGVHWLTEAP